MLTHWDSRPLPALLAETGLAGISEEDFPNDGWSGARLTLLQKDGERFVLKRTSWATDWIARHTRDHALREAFVAMGTPLARPLVAPYLGAAADGNAAAILMPDLSSTLFAWDRPGGQASVSAAELGRVLDALARLHAMPWTTLRPAAPGTGWPWCPLRERLTLLTRESAARYRDGGLPVGDRFLAGWEAFDRLAPAAARDLVARLTLRVDPLLDALGGLPSTGLHGDLKLANVALQPDGAVALIDWQMTALGPVAVELGWLLVSNVAQLAQSPDAVLARYRAAVDAVEGRSLALGPVGWPPPGGPARAVPVQPEVIGLTADAWVGDWDAQVDLTWIVGLLLRGWRKGLDAEAEVRFPWGADGRQDLELWSRKAVEAAARRL